MSKLNEIFNVEDRQEFIYDGMIFCISNGQIFYSNSDGDWEEVINGCLICKRIEHIDGIKIMPKKLKLTEQQITVIKGRIAEGWNWVATDLNNLWVTCFTEKPIEDNYVFYSSNGEENSLINKDIFDFVTYEDSPIYLPDLLKEVEE